MIPPYNHEILNAVLRRADEVNVHWENRRAFIRALEAGECVGVTSTDGDAWVIKPSDKQIYFRFTLPS